MTDDRYELTRRDLIQAGAAGLVVLGAGGCGFELEDAAADSPANVVLVVIDSLRTDHVGAYRGGRARAATPNLDAFARESLRFTQAHPEAMATIPARRAMMTGKRSYPFRNWKPEPGLSGGPGFQSIRPHEITVAEVANRAGFLTGYVTDNPHILARPYDRFRRSFDVHREAHGQTPLRRRPRKLVGNRELYKYWPNELNDQPGAGRLRDYISANRNRKREEDYLGARVYRAGMDFLQSAAARQPFMLVVDTFDVHEPWDPPGSYLRRYAKRARGPQPIQPFKTPSGLSRRLRASTLRRARALYAAEVTFIDTWFGHFMNRLELLGLAQSTWVIVISDHGVMLGERGIIGKSHSNLHRELTDVPLMIRHPGGVRAGTTTDYLASTHDIGPTILSAAGLRVPKPMTGQDLTGLFEGRRLRKRTYFTSAMKDHVVVDDGRWVLICHNQRGDNKLYDKRSDPREVRNVARRHPDQVRRLYRLARRDAGGRLPKFDFD